MTADNPGDTGRARAAPAAGQPRQGFLAELRDAIAPRTLALGPGVLVLQLLFIAVLSGLGGTLIVDQALGALTGHFWALWGTGALLVYAVAAVTMALQVLAGIVGIGLAVLVFVIAGNPSASGAYQTALLPPLWRAISYALPTGAATDTVRRVVYFAGHGITAHLLVISAWLAAGVAVSLIGSLRNERRRGATLACGCRPVGAEELAQFLRVKPRLLERREVATASRLGHARACTKWILRSPSGTRKRGSRASAASCAGQSNSSAQ